MIESLGEPTSIEQIAALTDEGAVRRRFDSHNATYIAAMSIFFILAGMIVTIVFWVNERDDPVRVLAAT